jgi:hypothetical protein
MPVEGRRPILAGRTVGERAQARRRRAEATWSEWLRGEFLRYFYAIGLLALVLFVPLQMAGVWASPGRPPVISLALVAVLAIAFDTAALYLGIFGYLRFWPNDGLVDRLFARRERPKK